MTVPVRAPESPYTLAMTPAPVRGTDVRPGVMWLRTPPHEGAGVVGQEDGRTVVPVRFTRSVGSGVPFGRGADRWDTGAQATGRATPHAPCCSRAPPPRELRPVPVASLWVARRDVAAGTMREGNTSTNRGEEGESNASLEGLAG
ncbi:hypothetical protein GCM10010332_53720 [Streptomyces albogriseolus]|nr:hypothetical protein GCM10010332_53720 [Streptomyces albogriseolus]